MTSTNPTTIYPGTDSTTISPTSTTTVVPLPCLGGDSCCSPTSQCGEGQGDCDRDTDCLGDLICVEEGCDRIARFSSFDPTDDCCLMPSTTPTPSPTTTEPCLGPASCCHSGAPCGEGQGDCDRDTDCLGDLICVEEGCDRITFPSFDS